ncbi:MAG TPA: homoserine kinase [Flavisolibacter sp.]|jgi:homoserine kinase|nr:homoserine kinase [Flavisolibacter sp.]
MKKVVVKSPATIANLVCGFDILGLCLEEPHDLMEVTLLKERKVVIDPYGGLPTQPELNTAGAPLLELLQHYPGDVGFQIKIRKYIKPGSGLGSSAASASGAVIAANHLLGNPFSKDDLVRFAMSGEKVASGVKHADNVAPGIYGGITLIRSIFPLDIVAIPAPLLYITVVHPQIEVKTADARQILRKEVQLKDAIKQWGNIAGLVAGLMKSDYDLIGRSLEDVLIEPVRRILIPGFTEMKQQCLQAGALGGGISGSGPSLFMLSRDQKTASKLEQVMKSIYTGLSLPHFTYVTTINQKGCTLLETE